MERLTHKKFRVNILNSIERNLSFSTKNIRFVTMTLSLLSRMGYEWTKGHYSFQSEVLNSLKFDLDYFSPNIFYKDLIDMSMNHVKFSDLHRCLCWRVRHVCCS